MGSYKDRVKALAHGVLDPVVTGMAAIGLRPNHLTVLGFVLSLGAAYAFAIGRFRTGATITLVAGLFDILDGQLARRTNTITRFGAFFDSALDRLADAAILLGIAGYFALQLVDMTTNPQRVFANYQRGLEPITYGVLVLLAVLAMVGGFMVSYTRARAEGLGLECKVGWFERPERMVLVILMGFAGLGPVIPAGLLVLATLSFVTAFQRMAHVWKLTREAGPESDRTEA
jgi:CDP-diacylglycerol--glycerol-3-phosphate 3-phosphatidyltransferase